LDLVDPKPQNTTTSQPKKQKTLVQAITNLCEIPLSQLPQAVVNGDRLAITIPKEEYLGVEASKYIFYRRII
jgi:hypothetical protein